METGFLRGGLGFGGDPIDAGEGRAFVTASQDFIERLRRAADHRLDGAVPAVAHPAVEAQGRRLLDHPVAISDTLDAPLDEDAERRARLHLR